MVYERQIFDQLRGELATKEIVVITGMRRVGKTTALRYLYSLVESIPSPIMVKEQAI